MSEEERQSRIIHEFETMRDEMTRKIDDLSGQIEQLRAGLVDMVHFTTDLTWVYARIVDLRCIIRRALSVRDGDLESIKNALKNVKDVNQWIEEIEPKASKFEYDLSMLTGYLQWFTRRLLRASRQWEIDFSELAPVFTETLGLQLARKALKREDILKTYGPSGLRTWDSLLSETSAE